MAWIWVTIPTRAALAVSWASALGSVAKIPRSRPAPSGRSGSNVNGSSIAAVRDPSDPSANSFCQPTRARGSGLAPSAAPLRCPRSAATAMASARSEAWTRTGSRPASDRRA